MTLLEFLHYLIAVWIPVKSLQVQQIHFSSDLMIDTAHIQPEDSYSVIPNYDRKLPMKTPGTLTEFVETDKELVNNYILVCLEKAITNDASETVLFKLGESRMIAKIVRSDFEDSLKKLDAYFLKTEAYENVRKCRDLINQVYVNRIINESKL